MDNQLFYVIFMTINFTLTLVMILAACLCCKKKKTKNEFMGLEGMVKLKNPDDIANSVENAGSQNDLNLSSTSNVDSEKRASNAPHRSLPDIPVADNTYNGSEMYETVADKNVVDCKILDKSPTSSVKKQVSVSQHSSISQADDVSSPYSRVKNSPHDYAKVCSAEHPYAQLNVPLSSSLHGADSEVIHETNSASRNASNQNLLQLAAAGPSVSEGQQEIPAASAIAGMVSASQELPYMTPPIASQTSYFSGDSQDSSKGYTSISVREPLANILAQSTKPRNPLLPITNDSHYATVSDDSDETYAAIEDPNNRLVRTEIYTSGSETYAQIQPMVSPIVVAVEINEPSYVTSGQIGSSNSRLQDNNSIVAENLKTNSSELIPIPPPVDNLRAQMHSRQASSSSNNSSMGNLGSPKPEKRQANSPLPPTPKTQQNLACSNSNLTSTSSSIASGRNSVASVIEYTASVECVSYNDEYSKKIRSLSPSKDIEGMYAKVMKKNKLVNASSQNNSPILPRKEKDNNSLLMINAADTDIHHGSTKLNPSSSANININMKSQSSNVVVDKMRTRSNSYCAKDHGYETIPADAGRTDRTVENRKSDCYTNILQKERLSQSSIYPKCLPQIEIKSGVDFPNTSKKCEHLQAESSNNSDAGYETLINNDEDKKVVIEPNYEVLKPSKYDSALLGDDGYAKVLENPRLKFDDNTDGYSKVKGEDDFNISGYSTINESKLYQANKKNHHNYASISETVEHPNHPLLEGNIDGATGATCSKLCDRDETDIYMRIPSSDCNALTPGINLDVSITAATSLTSTNNSLNISSNTLSTITSSHQTLSTNYESLTGSESDPNYESVSYMNKENTYERLRSDSNINSITQQQHGPTSSDNTNRSLLSQQSNVVGKVKETNSTNIPIEHNDTNGFVDDYFQV